MNNCFVWANDSREKKNANYLFTLTIECEKYSWMDISVSASGSYKAYLNGVETLYGPSRAAKGYFRAENMQYLLNKGKNTLPVLVTDYGVGNFAYVTQDPFFYFKMDVDGKTYTAADMTCYTFPFRAQKMQRYSFQRGFAEWYTLDRPYREIFENAEGLCERVAVKSVESLKELPRRVSPQSAMLPWLNAKRTHCGTFSVDSDKKLWADRSIYQVGNEFEGFYHKELDECLTDTVGKFVFTKGEDREELGEGEYAFYDFSRNVSGFASVSLEAIEDSEVYLIFDESVTEEGFVCPTRLDCANVVKWNLKKGNYSGVVDSLESLEAYTMQFAQALVTKGKIKVNSVDVRAFENNEVYNLKFEIADDKLERIVKAAQNTLAQNSVDLLMDCPSRERSGWINDIYFSMKSSELFSGGFNAVKNSLENYALYEDEHEAPEDMLPMCYPASHIDKHYIPQCAMWYVINLTEYLLKNPDPDLKEKGKRNAYRALKFFAQKENADGLLENLKGWNFIEWSKANSEEFVAGVNYPSNMMYYKMLIGMAQVWNDKPLAEKAEALKAKIIEQSFNGKFFEDNCVRNANGVLERKGHISETCQYYAFLMGVATREQFPELYKTMRDQLGPKRKSGILDEVATPNIIPGLLARETVLLQNGEPEQVLDEVKDIFFVMAEHYETLWEMVGPYASCNHGIASYAAYLTVRALTGFKGFENGLPIFTGKRAKLDCSFLSQGEFGAWRISVKDGKRTVQKRPVAQSLKQYIETNRTEQVRIQTAVCHIPQEGIEAVYYYVKGEQKVFAYLGYPKTEMPEGGYPAVLLVHGGGGESYSEWVKKWTDKGYIAIAPDFDAQYATDENHKKWHNPNGGPKGYGGYRQINEEENWVYFSVLSAMKAIDVLSVDARVNKEKIAVEGISWGGFLSLIIAAHEPRVKATAIKYSAGYIFDTEWGKRDARCAGLTESEKELFAKRFDPSAYLSKIKTPVFFAAGTEDTCFPMKTRARTANAIKAPVYHALRLDFPHGHYIGWETDESIAFADMVFGGEAIPEIKTAQEGNVLKITVDKPVKQISVVSTAETLEESDLNLWTETFAENGEVTLPEGTKAYFVAVVDENGLPFSTGVIIIAK